MKLTRRVLVSMVTIAALEAAGLPAARAVGEPEETVSMTLGDCLQQALQHNLDLRVAQLNPESANYGITFQKAVFDPVLGANAGYSSSPSDQTQEIDQISPVAAATTSKNNNTNTQWQGAVSLTQALDFGANYAVTLTRTSQSLEQTGFDPRTGLFTSSTQKPKTWDLGVQFRLPLLKGFGREVNRSAIILAANNSRLSEEDLRLSAMTTAKSTEDAYWDVAAARAGVNVANQSLKLAEDLYTLNKKKVEVGTLAPIEITQSEAGVASRQEGVITAENTLRNTEDNLRRLLAIPPNDPLWSKRIVPADKPSEQPVAIDLDAALSTAMERRPEIQSARVKLESQQLNERVAKKLTRHQLDLQANLDSSRLNYISQTVSPCGAGCINQVNTSTDATDQPVWRVALVYTYPFGNRSAKSNYAIAQVGREQAEIAEASAEQNIRVDVRTAARAVQSGAERVAAAKANTVLQQKTVDAELKKFENGMSTSFEVLRIQTDLTSAQLAEIQALLDYNKALSDFERAKGTLLEAKGLTLSTPEKTR